MVSVWEGRAATDLLYRRAELQEAPWVVLGIWGTGNYFAIITKSLLPFFHIPQQQERSALSSHRYPIPIEVNGNKTLTHLGESGNEKLFAWLCLCETLTTKVCISSARSFLTPSKQHSSQSREHHADSVNKILILLKSMWCFTSYIFKSHYQQPNVQCFEKWQVPTQKICRT